MNVEPLNVRLDFATLASFANCHVLHPVRLNATLYCLRSRCRYGFTVNNIHMRGSVLVFRNFSLLWNVQRIVDVTPRNIAIAHMISPRPGKGINRGPLHFPDARLGCIENTAQYTPH